MTFLQEPQFLHFPWLLTLLCVPSLVSLHQTLRLGFLRLAKLQLLHSLLAFLASLSVSLTELLSSCKSHKHYTFFWHPRLHITQAPPSIVNTLQPGYRSDIPLRALNCSSPHARVTSLISHCSSLYHHMSSGQELNFWDVLSAQKSMKDKLSSTQIPSPE